MNIAYIVKNFCVNKAKPEMHCNGKCYLSKKLEEQAKHEQQIPVTKKIKLDTDLFYTSVLPRLDIIDPQVGVRYKPVSYIEHPAFPPSVFRPPSV
jgi:hypothetical protein